jgi:hypothetical protein
MVRRSAARASRSLKSILLETDIAGMTAQELPDFDPGIIERYVENTYRKAAAVFIGSVVAGVMIGAVFGAMPLTSLGESWPIPRMFGFATMILGAILGGVVGYLIGDTRSFLARLQGQTALAQIHAANDARLALDVLREIQALATRRAAARPAAPAAPPDAPPVAPVEEAVPAPVVQSVAPAPVAPTAVAPAPVVAAVPPPAVYAVPDPVPVEPQPEPVAPVAPAAAPVPAEVAPAALEAVQAPPPPPVSS